jgi:peroxiredoxin family protein
MSMSKPKPKFVLFAHNATYDKLHQVATLALTAAAMEKDVIVVLLFWTIKKLAEGKIDVIDFPPEYAGSSDEVARLLKEKKVPKISEMFQEAKLVGKFRVIACSAGLEYMGVDGAAVEKNVDEVMGLPSILALTADAETKLFI